MQWNIPGTKLTCSRQEAEFIDKQFSAMFLGGGVVLGQICSLSGLEPHMVQNWIKRGLLRGPVEKKYDLNQLCRILTINALRKALPMEQIVGLLRYVNGSLTDTADDIIDDSQLYFMFVRVAATGREITSLEDMDGRIGQVMVNYVPAQPNARVRVEQVLRIMLTAWAASRLMDTTEKLMQEL